MKRREFLKGTLVGAVGCAFGMPLSFNSRIAHAAQTKTLVVIFQRGGCDGMNSCVPYGDPDYYALRPGIAIPPPDTLDPTSAIDLDGFFGLHPGLAAFKPIYEADNLAILPAVHYPQGSHSHFDSQHFIESAAQQKGLDGWVNRHMRLLPQTNPMRAIAIGEKLPQSMFGRRNVALIDDLDTFKLETIAELDDAYLSKMRALYSDPMGQANPIRAKLHGVGLKMIKTLNEIQQVQQQGYQTTPGVSYPPTKFGKQLRQVSQLIKAGVGLESATIDIDGWDTHAAQGGGEDTGRHYGRLKEFSDGISALYQDLGTHMNDVVILTCTEFGRTAKQNASGGTDHGNASTWFAIGNSIKGGVFGQWPGLSQSTLYKGRYLDFSIDYRNILGDILQRHLGNNQLAQMIPDHNYTPVGLFV